MKHITLMGDSIFDNKSYVGLEKPTISRLKDELREGETATLIAVDGNVTDDVHAQIARIPSKTTHLILSVGGNDALAEIDILNMPVKSSAEVLDELFDAGEDFLYRYNRLIEELVDLDLPLTLCTIYYPNFDDLDMRTRATAALATFNDYITLVAVSYGLPVIDLRRMFTNSDYYANAIEPSSRGSRKIAKVIRTVVDEHDFEKGRTSIYV
jgi:lysophospholipase L1-like esterase